MSKERGLLERWVDDRILEPEELDSLMKETKELLAQPEEGVYQRLLRIEDGIEVEILPSELWQDGYETGKRTMQPEQEPLLAETKIEWYGKGFRQGVNEIENYLAQPEQEHLSGKWWYGKGVEDTKYFLKREPLDNVEIMTIAAEHTWDLKSFARAIEKAHGIGVEQ